MKLKKDSVLARALTGVVAIASGAFMLGVGGILPAHADHTVEHQIEQLLAQIAALQAQLGAGSGSSGLYCSFTFTRDLSVGATGADVMNLQKFLNSVDGVQVAASGVGSAGNETSYYGPLTAQAVSAFQVKYAAEVLAPLGLSSGTGYFGASSRAKARALCDAAPAPSDDDDDAPADDDDDLSGGEGSMTDYEILSRYSAEELMEGQTDKIFGFQFKANSSDVSVRRIYLITEANADAAGSNDNAKAKPWSFVESVKLYRGDDVVAEMDADSSSDWSKISTVNIDGESDDDTYRLAFTGLSEIVREDDTANFTLEVTAKSTLDSGDLPQNFDWAVDTDGIRAVDAAGINIYAGSNAASYRVYNQFKTVTAGELTLSDSDAFDDDVVEKVSDTSTTDDVTVGMFEFEADEQDVTITDLVADVVVSGGSDVDNLVTNLGLYADGVLVESKVVSSSGASTTVTFDDIDSVVSNGSTVEYTLKADIQDLDGTTDQTEGVAVYTVVYGSNVTAEDEQGDSVTVSENWNADFDYTVSLYSRLPEISLTSATVTKGADDGSGNITSATYEIKFTVKAIGGDIFIPNDAFGTTTTNGGSTDGAEVQIVGSATASTAGTSDGSATLTSSDVTAASNFFKVSNGATRNFTANVRYDNDNNTNGDAFFHAKMIGINWATSTSNTTYATQQHFTSGFNGWQTDDVFLND